MIGPTRTDISDGIVTTTFMVAPYVVHDWMYAKPRPVVPLHRYAAPGVLDANSGQLDYAQRIRRSNGRARR